MKYFSEKTKLVYDTVSDLTAAEKEYDAKVAAENTKKKEREAKAKRVEEAFKKAHEAQKEANTLLSDFTKEYGSYHTTIKSGDMPFDSLFDMLFRM